MSTYLLLSRIRHYAQLENSSKYSHKKMKNAMIYILRTVGTETETYSNLNETFVTDARNLPGHLF